jgi:hypothetical protein
MRCARGASACASVCERARDPPCLVSGVCDQSPETPGSPSASKRWSISPSVISLAILRVSGAPVLSAPESSSNVRADCARAAAGAPASWQIACNVALANWTGSRSGSGARWRPACICLGRSPVFGRRLFLGRCDGGKGLSLSSLDARNDRTACDDRFRNRRRSPRARRTRAARMFGLPSREREVASPGCARAAMSPG